MFGFKKNTNNTTTEKSEIPAELQELYNKNKGCITRMNRAYEAFKALSEFQDVAPNSLKHQKKYLLKTIHDLEDSTNEIINYKKEND